MCKKRLIFFNCLLSALVTLSIIVSAKVTVVLNIPIACSFFIFPLVYLCISVINELGGGKSAIASLLSSLFILIISYLLLILVLNLPNQVDTINEANALKLILGTNDLNGYYMPNIKMMIGSIVGLLVSGFTLIGIYSSTNKYTFKPISCFLANLIALLIFNAIYVTVTQLHILDNHDFIMLLLNRFIFCVAWTIVITVLFSLFSFRKNKTIDSEIERETVENKKEKVINEKHEVLKKDKTTNSNNKTKNSGK